MQLVMWKYYRHKNNLQLNFINLVERSKKERGRGWGRGRKKMGKREEEVR